MLKGVSPLASVGPRPQQESPTDESEGTSVGHCTGAHYTSHQLAGQWRYFGMRTVPGLGTPVCALYRGNGGTCVCALYRGTYHQFSCLLYPMAGGTRAAASTRASLLSLDGGHSHSGSYTRALLYPIAGGTRTAAPLRVPRYYPLRGAPAQRPMAVLSYVHCTGALH